MLEKGSRLLKLEEFKLCGMARHISDIQTPTLASKYPWKPVSSVLEMMPQAKPLNGPMSSRVSGFCFSDTVVIRVTKFCLQNWGFCLEWIFHARRWSENIKGQLSWDILNRLYEQLLFSHLLINVTYFKTSEANNVYQERTAHDWSGLGQLATGEWGMVLYKRSQEKRWAVGRPLCSRSLASFHGDLRICAR